MLTKVKKYARKWKALSGLYCRCAAVVAKLCLFRIKFPDKKFVFISLYEHIGDIIATEPVITYAASQYPKTFIVWVTSASYVELLEAHPQVDYILPIIFFGEWIVIKKLITKLNIATKIFDLHLDKKKCLKYKFTLSKPSYGINQDNFVLNTSMLESFSTTAGLPALTDAPVFYVNNAKELKGLPKNYIVFHTQSNHYMKDWPSQKWLQLCDALIVQGLYVVEVGTNKQISIVNDHYIDFTGRRSLQSIANIIAGSKLFIGVESGFAHMANALNKNGLVMIGQYKIRHYTFTDYKPYTGKYKDEKYIIYSSDHTVQSIEVATVLERVKEQIAVPHNVTSE